MVSAILNLSLVISVSAKYNCHIVIGQRWYKHFKKGYPYYYDQKISQKISLDYFGFSVSYFGRDRNTSSGFADNTVSFAIFILLFAKLQEAL